MLKRIEKSMVMGLFLSLMIGGMILSFQPAGHAGQVRHDQSAIVVAQSGDSVVVMEASLVGRVVKGIVKVANCIVCVSTAIVGHTDSSACAGCAGR